MLRPDHRTTSRSRWLASLAKGAAPNGIGGLVPMGVAFEVLRISSGSGRVQLFAAEHEEHWLRGTYAPVIVGTSGSP
jgi:hypothetical protein